MIVSDLLVEKDKHAESRKSNPVEGAEPRLHLEKGHSASGSLSSVTRADFGSVDYLETRSHALVQYKGSASSHTTHENGHKHSLNTPSGGSLKLSGSKRNFSDGKQYNSPFRKAKKHTAPTKSVEREVSVLEILNIWSHKQRLEFYAYLRREFIEENYLALDAIGDILQQHRLGVLTVESVRSKVYKLYFSPDATWTVEVPLELALELDELLGFDADVFGMNGFGAVKHQVKLTDVVNLMQRVYQTLESSVTKSFISFTGEANLTANYHELMSEHAGISPRAPPMKHAHEARSPFGQRRSKYSDKSPLY